MKCPYRNFEECLVEKCPSCNYIETKKMVIDRRKPNHNVYEDAYRRSLLMEKVKTTYEFVSCKLVENGVQPIPQEKKVINNTTKTSIVVNKSIF